MYRDTLIAESDGGPVCALGCLFSGVEPDTDEHVIPDWLQRRFGLQRQRYRLPNETGLDYRHAKVPASYQYNRIFGEIETRISRDQFVWEEVYLWLMKIHIGLMYRNISLRQNIRDQNSTSIVPEHLCYAQLGIFRQLCNQYFTEGRFDAHSSPPGSVFVLPSFGPRDFDFSHSFTCGCVGVNIGDYFVASSLWDFGLAKEFGYFDWNWNRDHYGSPPAELNESERMTFYHHIQRIWLCNLGYWSMRWNINMYRLTPDHQPEMPCFEGAPRQRPEDPEELALICTTFGLELDQFIPGGRSRYSSAYGRARET